MLSSWKLFTKQIMTSNEDAEIRKKIYKPLKRGSPTPLYYPLAQHSALGLQPSYVVMRVAALSQLCATLTTLNLTLYQRYRVRRRRLPLHGAATRASSRAGLRECMGVKPADSSAKLPSLLLVVWGIPRVVLRVEGGLRRVHTRTDGAAGVCIPARACWW